jgi:hypothetical protein
MSPWIPWVVFTDPLGSAEHSLGNSALEQGNGVESRPLLCNIFPPSLHSNLSKTHDSTQQHFDSRKGGSNLYGPECVFS